MTCCSVYIASEQEVQVLVGNVIFNMSMSLDGFVAGTHDSITNPLGDGGDHLFTWYGSGDTAYTMPGGDWTFNLSAASAARLDQAVKKAGVLVTGRKTFDIAGAWNGRHPLDVPVVVLTHHPPPEWMKAGSPFTFVTDGIESAIRQARALAGTKDVEIGTASTLQQCINAGLLDEIDIDLVPLILGSGVRLFDHLNRLPLRLEQGQVVVGQGVTHIQYRVIQ